MKKSDILFVALLLNLLLTSFAFGCKYTLREIGFVNLSDKPYYLYFFTQNDQPRERASTILNMADQMLESANLNAEVVNVDEQKEHAAIGYLSFWQAEPLQTAVLVSPEGQSMLLHFDAVNGDFKQAIRSVMTKAVSSPVRKKILTEIVPAYCIVLLVDGDEAGENKAARTAVKEAGNNIRRIMKQMPKPVHEPPLLIEITREMLQSEKVLLWSLGLTKSDFTDPSVVLIYGRGRKMGPVVRGEHVNANYLYNLLALIGADCECGLDRSWMLGTMIPLCWEQIPQQDVIRFLGFDAENPMILSEITQILGIVPSQTEKKSDPTNSNLTGYSEGVIKFKDDTVIPRVSYAQFQKLNTEKSFPWFGRYLWTIIVFSVFILATGVILFVKVRRRK